MIQDNSLIQDVIPPEQVSFWPPQPGWYIVLAFLLALICYIGWRRYLYWLKNAYKREAVERIHSLSKEPDFFLQLNEILKAVAIKSYGRKKVARLSGKEWTTFLSTSENSVTFNSTVLNYLEAYHYQKPKEPIADTLISISKADCINWIKKHK